MNNFLTAEDWEFCREVEGVLRIQKHLTTLSQNEEKLNASFGPLLKQQTRTNLTAGIIELIDIESWSTYSRVPRLEKYVNDMSKAGRICRKRAILETERSFFGNHTEDTYDEQEGLSNEQITKRVEMSDREFGVLLLDPRTCFDEIILDRAGWKKAFKVLEDEYIKV